MTIYAMIDLETLDTAASSVILSVGAVKFDPYSLTEPRDKTLWKPDLETQLENGRTTSEATIQWWGKQDRAIRDRAFTQEGRVDVITMLRELNQYLVGVEEIWAQGPQFDITMLEHLYSQHDLHWNWDFWQIRDSRTLFSLRDTDPRKEIQVDTHDAAEDAYWQAVCVQRTFDHFQIRKS